MIELHGTLVGMTRHDGRDVMEIEVIPDDGSPSTLFALHASRCKVAPSAAWLGRPVFIRALDTIVLEMVVQVV